MLDVLMYIFENYVNSGAEFTPDQTVLESHLMSAGFEPHEIARVAKWLDGLMNLQATNQRHRPEGGHPVRIYTTKECQKLDAECRGFLLALEHAGVLSPIARELVISRAVSFEGDNYLLSLEQLKWIVVLVLFHKPNQANVITELEDFTTKQGAQSTLH